MNLYTDHLIHCKKTGKPIIKERNYKKLMNMFYKKILISLFTLMFYSNCMASEFIFAISKTPEHNENSFNLGVEYIFSLDQKILGAEPHIGANINLGGYTSSVYTGLVWQKISTSGIFIAGSLGGALHNGKLKPNNETSTKKSKGRIFGSRILFRESLAVGYAFSNHKKVSIFVDHMSNANLAKPNQGSTNLGIRYAMPL